MAQREHPLPKRSLEDIAATQADHTLFFARIVEDIGTMRTELSELDGRLTTRLDAHTSLLNEHMDLLHEILSRLPAKE